MRGQVVSTSSTFDKTEPKPLGVWLRQPEGGGLSLFVVQQEQRRGPLAGYWHLPTLEPEAAIMARARPAGRYAAPAWGPAGPATRLFVLAETHPAMEASRDGSAPPGFWRSVAELRQGHALGLWVLSPILWTVVQALAALARHAHQQPQALTEAAAAGVAAAAGAPAHPLGENIRAMPLLTPTLPPATHTNCYLLGHNRLTLVDPGTPYPEDQQHFLQYLEGLTGQGATLEAIWISHFHDDHIGAAMAVRAQHGAPILAHADTQAALQGRIEVDRVVADNALLSADGDVYTALHTPGHARGHLCFVAHRGGHLLSGDNILGTGTPIVPPSPHGSMADYMASLRRLSGHARGMLLPGHGPPCASAALRLTETLTARLQREDLLMSTLASLPPPVTLGALVDRVYRGLGASLRGLAELSTLAHLQKLQHEGRVEAVPTASVPAWRLPIAQPPSVR
jgi:glyoxylase-like metal-dependent hydrolase (beta-lactamase superfamily II)